MKSVSFTAIMMGALLLLGACNNGNTGVTQAELDQIRQQAEAAQTMAAEARDIAMRAEQKADQALAAANAN